ncbi:unnamed protein product [Amoebophrya sp. A25]|nr:unnamed protein product [Amoebophrya sp. A25]|eukprot:GSA25T00024655001.1
MQSVSLTTRFAQILRPFATCATQTAQLVPFSRRFSLYMSAPEYLPQESRYMQFSLLGYSSPTLPSIDGSSAADGISATLVSSLPGSLSTTHTTAPDDRNALFFPAANDKVYFYIAEAQKIVDDTYSLEMANLGATNSTVGSSTSTLSNSDSDSASASGTLESSTSSSASTGSVCAAHLENNLISIAERTLDESASACANFRANIFRTIPDPAPALRGYFEEAASSAATSSSQDETSSDNPALVIKSLAEGSTHHLPSSGATTSSASSVDASSSSSSTDMQLPAGFTMNKTHCFGQNRVCRIARHTKFQLQDGFSYRLCFLRWSGTQTPSLISSADVRVKKPPVRKVIKFKIDLSYQPSQAANEALAAQNLTAADVNAGLSGIVHRPETYTQLRSACVAKVQALYGIPESWIAKLEFTPGSLVVEMHLRMLAADYNRVEMSSSSGGQSAASSLSGANPSSSGSGGSSSGTDTATSTAASSQWLEQALYEDLKNTVLLPILQADYIDAQGGAPVLMSLNDLQSELVVLNANDPSVVDRPRVVLPESSTSSTQSPPSSTSSSDSDSSDTSGTTVGLAIGIPCGILLLIGGFLFWRYYLKRDEEEDDALFPTLLAPDELPGRRYSDSDVEIVQEEEPRYLMRKWFHVLMDVDQPLVRTCVFCSQTPEDLACAEVEQAKERALYGDHTGEGGFSFSSMSLLPERLLALGSDYGRVQPPGAGSSLYLVDRALGREDRIPKTRKTVRPRGEAGGEGVDNALEVSANTNATAAGVEQIQLMDASAEPGGTAEDNVLKKLSSSSKRDSSNAVINKSNSARLSSSSVEGNAAPRLHLAVYVSRSNPDVRITCCNYCVKLANKIFMRDDAVDEWRKLSDVDVSLDAIQRSIDDFLDAQEGRGAYNSPGYNATGDFPGFGNGAHLAIENNAPTPSGAWWAGLAPSWLGGWVQAAAPAGPAEMQGGAPRKAIEQRIESDTKNDGEAQKDEKTVKSAILTSKAENDSLRNASMPSRQQYLPNCCSQEGPKHLPSRNGIEEGVQPDSTVPSPVEDTKILVVDSPSIDTMPIDKRRTTMTAEPQQIEESVVPQRIQGGSIYRLKKPAGADGQEVSALAATKGDSSASIESMLPTLPGAGDGKKKRRLLRKKQRKTGVLGENIYDEEDGGGGSPQSPGSPSPAKSSPSPKGSGKKRARKSKAPISPGGAESKNTNKEEEAPEQGATRRPRKVSVRTKRASGDEQQQTEEGGEPRRRSASGLRINRPEATGGAPKKPRKSKKK